MTRLVKITESRTTQDGHFGVGPEDPKAKRLPTHHQVYVGNEEEGWVEVPRVTDVDLDLRQGQIRKAVITVLFPQVDFEGGYHGA